jgi:3-oxoacyl-[acyl-carrier protein] reductase
MKTSMTCATSTFAPVQKSVTALNRYGQPVEVAALIAFFASPTAANITGACIGACINVEGGFNA